WTSGGNGLPNGFSGAGYLCALVVDPKHPRVLYGTNYANGVYKSIDGGEHWSTTRSADQFHPCSLAIDPKHPVVVWGAGEGPAGVASELYRTTDASRSWHVVPSPGRIVPAVALVPRSRRT